MAARATPATGHLLVSFDQSKKGERRLRVAVAEARRLGARLTVAILIPIEETTPCCDRKVVLWNDQLRRVALDEAEHVRASLPRELPFEVVIHEGQGRGALEELRQRLGCDAVIGDRPRAAWRRPRRRGS